MTGKLIDILKNGSLVIPKQLLTSYKKLNITDNELPLVIYLLNNSEFNPAKIAEDLGLTNIEVLTLIDSLSKKDVLKLESITNNNICEEYVSLDELYNKLVLLMMEDKEEPKETTIYDQFEKEFGRTLSPMEYEIIGAWIEAKFSEEVIILALKEAIYNGVTNLRYIDKILYEWQKKGIKNKEDYERLNKKPNKKESSKEVFSYDWLDE